MDFTALKRYFAQLNNGITTLTLGFLKKYLYLNYNKLEERQFFIKSIALLKASFLESYFSSNKLKYVCLFFFDLKKNMCNKMINI